MSEIGLSKKEVMASSFHTTWQSLSQTYLPIESAETIWRFSHKSEPREPTQGWKLHISATILEACDLFEKVAPFLISQDVQFKAPKSLKELSKLNCGLQYGYWQVGKFITVYPSTTEQAVRLAAELHELTSEFIPLAIPFDEQYLPQSSVFYRYGAFTSIEVSIEPDITLPAIENPAGELVYDDRFRAVPEWLSDPFKNKNEAVEIDSESTETPLMTTYKVFRAITQRGKGGTYQALDLSVNPTRFCIVKEGRRHGEISWNGQDGYFLVKNEFEVLKALRKTCPKVPQIFASFEIDGNFYVAMEYVEGKSLNDLMKNRRRRFSIRQTLEFAVEIAKTIGEIHRAGWIWSDCKPANLIVTNDNSLRPIDFEGAYPAGQNTPFDWKTQGFSKPGKNQTSSYSDDLYALGAVLYFLLTGKLYEQNALPIKKLRRNVPSRLQTIIETLLSDMPSENKSTVFVIAEKFEEMLNSNCF